MKIERNTRRKRTKSREAQRLGLSRVIVNAHTYEIERHRRRFHCKSEQKPHVYTSVHRINGASKNTHSSPLVSKIFFTRNASDTYTHLVYFAYRIVKCVVRRCPLVREADGDIYKWKRGTRPNVFTFAFAIVV